MRREFGFDGGPAPSLDVFGFEFFLNPFGLAFSVLLLPFALGVLAQKNLGWALAAFTASLLAASSQQALLIHVGGLASTRIPFPWGSLGAMALASSPAATAGYLAARFFEKRKIAKGV